MTAVWRHDYGSWGRVFRARHRVSQPLTRRDALQALTVPNGLPVMAYGCGRSYGDVGLNPEGNLIDCTGLDRFIAFDAATGVLTCESGVRLADILAAICRPEPDGAGWLLPVTPGTRFVTVGGAIANDVHGKNHHRFGTFGCHVISFELARSDGSRMVCSRNENPGFFAATIGGLGLTGLILQATIQLRRVPGLAVEAEDIRFDSLADFFDLARESDADWEYTAAWIDCTAHGRGLGRGIYSRARHVAGRGTAPPSREPRFSVPNVLPFCLVSPLAVKIFNAAYWRKLGGRGRARHVGSYEGVFYPLDAVGHWNRVYGPLGFYQFQCVVPLDKARDTLAELIGRIAASGQGSALSVLKLFGPQASPGLLSFPEPGATLALDFANRGARTRALMAELERMVVQAGGRLYPAKDALMQAETFRRGYPDLARFLRCIDPGFTSAFARRVAIVPASGLEAGAMNESPSPGRTVAIFGATSSIATAVARRYAEAGHRLVLAGRDAASLAALKADLVVRGAPAIAVLHGDFAELDTLPALAGAAWDQFGGLDVALIAYGTMADQAEAERDAATTVALLTVNLTGTAVLLNELASRFQSSGRGTIAAITSVAGDRGRRSNYVYGAAKGGLQRLLEGLRHRLAAAGVAVVDIRPGFVATKMTAHLDRSSPLWATPDKVAADIVRAIGAGRPVCYTPGFWRLIMFAVRATPRFIFHRTSL